MSEARTLSNRLLREWCAPITGDVLSLGSQQDGDGDGGCYRAYFTKARSYTTSDVTPGCDRVLDARAMPEVPDGSYDAILCGGVLEHIDAVHEAVAECYRVLRLNGVFLVGVPFQWGIHRPPQDFWRFTQYGVRYLLRAFRIEELQSLGGTQKFPHNYWARARKVAA